MSILNRFAVALALLATSTIRVDAQTRIYNTGVDADAAALGLGQTDPHWRWITGQISEPIAGSGSSAVTNFYPNGWIAPNSTAQWISTGPGYDFPGDAWTTFYQEFDLQNLDPTTVQLSGLFGVDDFGAYFLNGESISVTYGSFDPFRALNPLIISGGFRQGRNTLAVQVHNSACPCMNPSGLLLQDLTLTGTPTVVSEPATQALLLCSIAGLWMYRRRRDCRA